MHWPAVRTNRSFRQYSRRDTSRSQSAPDVLREERVMQLNVEAITSTDPVAADGSPDNGVDAPDLRIFVFALFLVFGGITSLTDVIIPKLKDLFTLSYAQAMLVQSAFFAAYRSEERRVGKEGV